MTVQEWIKETKARLERDNTSVLYDSEVEKIRAWQHTGWMAVSLEQAASIADIQIQFVSLLLNHALALSEMREEMQVVIHKMQGEKHK